MNKKLLQVMQQSEDLAVWPYPAVRQVHLHHILVSTLWGAAGLHRGGIQEAILIATPNTVAEVGQKLLVGS